MDKRLNRTDYLFALMFIFMLVCILGAFFYGIKIGKEKSDQKYEGIFTKQAIPEPGAYDQQFLVSYYHTIYLPFREFQNQWFEQMKQIEIHSTTVDASAAFKELSKLSDEKYQQLKGKTMPASSPLLQQSHQGYLRSLKLFTDALKNFQGKANSMNGIELLDAMDKDAYFIEAKTQALTAQKDYFNSIVKWNQTLDSDLAAFDNSKMATLDDWRQMNLNVKNLYVSAQLLNGKHFVSYYPQDLTIRIEDFVASGQAKKLNAADVKQTMDLLISTDAVRTGDFAKGMSKWYSKETLPQLPFFSGAN
jgi:hypothetical protein